MRAKSKAPAATRASLKQVVKRNETNSTAVSKNQLVAGHSLGNIRRYPTNCELATKAGQLADIASNGDVSAAAESRRLLGILANRKQIKW